MEPISVHSNVNESNYALSDTQQSSNPSYCCTLRLEFVYSLSLVITKPHTSNAYMCKPHKKTPLDAKKNVHYCFS